MRASDCNRALHQPYRPFGAYTRCGQIDQPQSRGIYSAPHHSRLSPWHTGQSYNRAMHGCSARGNYSGRYRARRWSRVSPCRFRSPPRWASHGWSAQSHSLAQDLRHNHNLPSHQKSPQAYISRIHDWWNTLHNEAPTWLPHPCRQAPPYNRCRDT